MPFHDNFLLFSDTYQKEIYQMDATTGQFVALPLPSHDNPIAVDYDPGDSKVYWSDVSARVLKRAHLNGSREEVMYRLPPGKQPTRQIKEMK